MYNLYFYMYIHKTCMHVFHSFKIILWSMQLRVYAGRQNTGIIQDSANTDLVGFSLPEVQVTPTGVRYGSHVPFYILYVVSTIALYLISTTAIFFVVSKTNHKGVKSFTRKNPEILIGVTVVVTIFIVLEVVTHLIMSIIWVVHVDDPLITFTVISATLLFYSPGLFSLFKVSRKFYLYRIGHYNKLPCRYGDNPKVNTFFKCVVWIIAYFAYIIQYAFFPAFILTFAYPIRIITIFVFCLTFMFFSIVYLTTYLKKGVPLKVLCDRHSSTNVFLVGFIWFIIAVTLIYFFLFIFALLYSLVIGRASVASSAPLALLSLLPSILISILAWILKSTLLETAENQQVANNTEGREQLESEDNGEPGRGDIEMAIYHEENEQGDERAQRRLRAHLIA